MELQNVILDKKRNIALVRVGFNPEVSGVGGPEYCHSQQTYFVFLAVNPHFEQK